MTTSTIAPSSNNNADLLMMITPERSDITKTATSFKPLLITPSKITCSRPLFVFSPRQKKHSPSKFELKVKIKRLQQKIRRQSTSINNLKDLLKDFRKKNLLENNTEELLLEKFEGTSLELFKNLIKNKGRKATGRRYSKAIKEFSLTLHYYSPKAYEYAR